MKLSALPQGLLPNLAYGVDANGASKQFRAYPPINARDHGAIGDGNHDDTPNLQAAINACFGPPNSPNGDANRKLNRPLYLPPGTYRITTPLYIRGVQGGHIFGDGPWATHIASEVQTGGNAIITSGPGSEVSPAIMMDGCAYLTMEGFTIGSLFHTAGTCGIYYTSIGSFLATLCVFRHMGIGNFEHGMLVGYAGSGGNCDNGSLYNVVFGDCPIAGLKAFHQNALNWQVYGGGASNCGHASTYDPVNSIVGNYAGGYVTVGGSISTLAGLSCTGNKWDFMFGSSASAAIIGGSCESTGCCISLGSPVFMTGYDFRCGPSANVVWLEGTFSGQFHVSSCTYNPTTDNGVGKVANLGNNGRLIMDNIIFGPGATSCSVFGGANSYASARNVTPFAPQNLWANFTGTKNETGA